MRLSALFVPERQVQPDAGEHVREQNDRQHADALPEIAAHQQSEQIHEQHDRQEDADGHDDEVLERLGIAPAEVFLPEGRQEVRLGRVAVHLREQHQHDAQLRDGSVDTERIHRALGRQQILDHLPVDELVGRSGDPADKQGQRIEHDRAQQLGPYARPCAATAGIQADPYDRAAQ